VANRRHFSAANQRPFRRTRLDVHRGVAGAAAAASGAGGGMTAEETWPKKSNFSRL
jgi:hypothetical protein